MKKRLAKFNQDGVALLLTVMLISGIAIISVTVAFFVIQNVREARSSTMTEPAIIAAETAAEQGIYLVKRGGFTTNCNSAAYTDIAGGTTSSGVRIKKCIESVPATFQFSRTNPLTFYIYDPDNVNNNLCMEKIDPPTVECPTNGSGGSGAQLFTKIIIDYLSGNFQLDVVVETLDDVSVDSGIITPGGRGEYAILRDILNSVDERLKVTVTPASGTATVSVSTEGEYTGLPDYQTVNAEGCVAPNPSITNCDSSLEVYKRRINITLPR